MAKKRTPPAGEPAASDSEPPASWQESVPREYLPQLNAGWRELSPAVRREILEGEEWRKRPLAERLGILKDSERPLLKNIRDMLARATKRPRTYDYEADLRHLIPLLARVYRVPRDEAENLVLKDIAMYLEDLDAAPKPKEEPPAESDGPVPPDGFRYGETVYKRIAKGPFLVLAAAWSKEGHCIHKDDLSAALGDREELLAEFAMQSIRGELNEFFRGHEIPWHAKVKGLFLAIEKGKPRATTNKASSRAGRHRSR